MDIDNAPRPENDEDRECGICEEEGTFVLHEGDKVCRNCGHAPTSNTTAVKTERAEDKWTKWFDHRKKQYSGWYGEDRIKFPGGFAAPYDFGADFE